MTLLVWLIFTYEIFSNLLAEFVRQGVSSPVSNLSALERKIFVHSSTLSILLMGFGTIARINGIALLVYLGFTTIWWHPIVIWIGCLVGTGIAASLFRGTTGLAIPALLSFVILPVTGVSLWLIV